MRRSASYRKGTGVKEAEIQVYIKAAFSASFLVSESDGEITADEVGSFMQALRERHDLDLDEEDVWESFRDALQLDEEDHLSRVAGAAGLSEELRREIVNIAFAVAVADGEFALSEILCLPDIAAALGIELGEGDEDEDEADTEIEDDADSEASGKFAASIREAEAALKAEGNPAPSAAEISQRAISDMLSGMAGNLEATLVQRRGFAAWEAGDYEAAYGFYLEAAEAGDKDAMFNLGQMYQAGEWVDVDLDEALGWWQRAAAKGQLMAQQNAWVTFWQRDDLKSALEYAGMAAAQGDEESARFVREQILSRAPDSDGTVFDEITDYARARQPQRSSGKTTHQLARAIDLIDPDLPMVSGDQGGAPEEWRTRAAALSLQEASEYLRCLSGSPLFTLTDEVFAAFSPDGTKILSWGCAPEDYTLSVWASETGNRQLKIDLEERFRFAAFSFDGTKIISHSDDNLYNDGFRTWDTQTAELLRHVNNGTTYCELVVSPSTPHLIALGNSEDFAHLYNYDTGDLLLDLRLQNTAWPDAAFSSDGSTFLILQPGDSR
jgi:tellurite resistance protein